MYYVEHENPAFVSSMVFFSGEKVCVSVLAANVEGEHRG